MNERSLLLLKSLVEHFIQDGQPVASRTLARDSKLNLSPATIRGVMADLEELGFLSSPHTSAGRVPTVKGYRLFIDSLLKVDRLAGHEVANITHRFFQNQDRNSLLEHTSSILSDITHMAGVVMLSRNTDARLEHMEFINLSDHRVLVILVTSDQDIQNRIIQVSRPYSASELQQASNYLNRHLSGRPLSQLRRELLRDLQDMKDSVMQIMQAAIDMAQRVASSHCKEEDDLMLAGETNLMDAEDLCNVEKLKRLFDSFRRKRDILHLLEQAIHAHGVHIFIGEESGYEVLDGCSVVTAPYEREDQILGVLGVIGPTRMQYERVIPIVDLTAKMLGAALNSMEQSLSLQGRL